MTLFKILRFMKAGLFQVSRVESGRWFLFSLGGPR